MELTESGNHGIAESRNGLSRLRDRATTRLRDQRGSALAAVLVLVVLLTMVGVAMVNSTFTEISVAYNAGDTAAAQYAAEAGLSRAIYELSQNAGWTGTTAAIGTGQYVVTVTSSGLIRSITSTGTQGGGRRVLKAAVKTLSQSAVSTVLANTTATIGSSSAGLTVSNDYPSSAASAVHANDQLSAPTAISVNTAGANVIGGLTANGVITGVGCPTWAWTCNAGAGTRAMPEIDVDSAATTSLKYRAQHTNDPVDGKPVYFKGGDTTYRCNTGSPWVFTSTQQCWDYYVNSKSGTLGSGITNPVYFVEFTASESTNYTTSGGGSLAFRAGQSTNYNGLGLGNCIKVPTGIVNGDVVLAAISWSDGTSEAITTPANYALNLTPSDLGGGTAYALRSTNSDLSGGLDFNRELNPGTETAGSIAVSVAAGATEDSFGFTRAGQPGVSGITGNYIVEMNVTVANANILLSTAVARVNSVGVLQTLSGFAAEQSAGSTGVKTFSLTSVNLGTWSSGDRLKVYYRFRNTAASAQSVTLQTGTTSAEAMAPWTIGDFNKELGDFSTDISLAVSVAASATEDSFGFTPSGVPGAIGVTGDYWLSNYVTAANSNIWLSVALARVDSGGVEQTRSSFTAETQLSTTGQKTFSFTGLNLGTWSSGNRLKVYYRFRNAAASVQSVTIATPVSGWGLSNMIKTPWSSGWTLVRRINNSTSVGLAVYWKVASNESGRVCRSYSGAGYDFAFSPGSGSQSMTGAIVAYSGVDTTTPIDVENGQATSSGATHSTPSITTSVANTMLVASFGLAGTGTWTPPAGMTERSDSTAQAVALEVADVLQVSAGASGTKTATASASKAGATHILALKPGGGTTVTCGGSSYTETLCIRTTAASGLTNSVLTQLNGAIVSFRRGSGTSVSGDIVFQNTASASANYTHTYQGSDPALLAGGKISMISSGASAGRTSTSITGIVYTLAGSDNPDGNGNLQGASSGNLGFDLQHGADSIAFTLSGLLLSNGSISLQDTGGTGTATIQYNRTVVENLPAAFTTSTAGSFMIPLSWSSGD